MEKAWQNNYDLHETTSELMNWTYSKRRDGKKEELLTETFANHLGLGNVKIEKEHRIGNLKISTKLKIIVTLARYKDKQKKFK